jgi:pantoate--beta-alanine ligase
MADHKDFLILKTVAEVREWRNNVQGSLGFIPTMGYLHVGHVSLINRAREENDYVVVSIFVNPKQFGPKKDFNKYPRDVTHDLHVLKDAKVDVLFLPDVDEMYPEGFETKVSVTQLSKKLEGAKRPGHFDGVTTVISKLFNIIQPTSAYFGQKDAQQVIIIKKMVFDLQFPVHINVGDTIRGENGLALSSRNVHLQQKEKEEAATLSESLLLAQKLFQQGERNPETIKNAMKQIIKKTTGLIDYISIANPRTLDELILIDKEALVSLAVYFGKTRLIDNCLLNL